MPRTVKIPYVNFEVVSCTFRGKPCIRVTHKPTGVTTRAYESEDEVVNTEQAMRAMQRNTKFKKYVLGLAKDQGK